jgi:RNA recognition motif-containing protein
MRLALSGDYENDIGQRQTRPECVMNIYVGNLSFNTTEEQLRQAFEGYGEVKSVAIISDKFTGESRGFAFVEMPDKDAATAAINGVNGQELNGRKLNINEARPRTDRPDRGGGGGGRGGGDRGGFGGGGGRGGYRGGGGGGRRE